MKELEKQIEGLKAKARETWSLLDLDAVATQLKTLEADMAAPDFWSDQERAKQVGKQAADLRDELGRWQGFLKEIDDLLELVGSGDESIHDDVASGLEDLNTRFAKMEFTTLFSGEHDKNDAILSFHAGSGGSDAQDWAEMLMRMIFRFCEKKGFEVSLHTVTSGNDKREDTIKGYEKFKALFGTYPKINIMHSRNRENIYWGRKVFKNSLLRFLVGIYDKTDYSGEDINSPYFWGDICD